jgi:hypothetical protein
MPLAGLVTLFALVTSVVTSLTHDSGPIVQAAAQAPKPTTAHYASMTDLLNLFGTP